MQHDKEITTLDVLKNSLLMFGASRRSAGEDSGGACAETRIHLLVVSAFCSLSFVAGWVARRSGA